MERPYDFRKRLLEVHRPGLRRPDARPGAGRLEITGDHAIFIDADAGPTVLTAAKDLQDYLFISMGVSVAIRRRGPGAPPPAAIVLKEDPACPAGAPAGSFHYVCAGEGIRITGNDGRGVARGVYYLEDRMTLARAPFAGREEQTVSPAFSPRMVHSGYGLDWFPDAHLRDIAHAGMDAVLVFVKGPNQTPAGFLDFNELIYRAGRYGLDVYAYSYMESLVHPGDPGALAHYQSTYGALFAQCPGFKGVVLVGESVEFPSRDPAVSGRRYFENTEEGIPAGKPTAGWWPCCDYPQWLEMVRDVIRPHNPDVDIVFWTYNWGYAPEAERLRLIEAMPRDISLMVTFEMFEERRLEDVKFTCADYTLSFEGPGRYFLSEAAAAKKRGLRLYTQACAAGLTWDIGVIPYEPCPYQWAKRYDAMLAAREQYGLCGVMEGHHFGFWPSIVSFVEKYMFATPKTEGEQVCRQLAESLFGPACAPAALEAWRLWSEGITHSIPSNEDQYGPMRVGPGYPLVFRSDVEIPSVPYAHFGGNAICVTNYAADSMQSINAYTVGRSSHLQQRLPAETRSLERMRNCFAEGSALLEGMLGQLDACGREECARMAGLGRFIECCAQTAINVKRWHSCRLQLRVERDDGKLAALFEQMVQIGREEMENTRRAIPLVQADSRLGYEPSMEYMADEAHLRWKLRQVEQVINTELPPYIAQARQGAGG